jgi:hypothetical protein
MQALGQMQPTILVVCSADQMKITTRKKEWFDDSFWRELYPFMLPKERIADADAQVEKALVRPESL